ncbi:MAG: DUF4352 domain-containing protein [Anaerolineales bacterium]|jgi:type VI secretion system protein VasI
MIPEDFLAQGIAAAKAGNKQEARRLLYAAIRAAPNDERTWGWFYNVCENDEERLGCLKEVLRINPGNEKAKFLLQKLSVQQKPNADLRAQVGITSTIQSQLKKKENKRWIFWLVGGVVFVFVLLVTILIGSYLINNGNQRIITNLPTQKVLSNSSVSIPTVTQSKTYSGNWQTSLGKSAFDDSPTVVISLNAESPIQGWLTSYVPQLSLRCQEHNIDVFITTGMSPAVEYGMNETATIRLRFDSSQEITTIANESTDGKALFLPAPTLTIRAMLLTDKLAFGFTPFNASPVVTTFNLQGLSVVIKPLEEACNWNGTSAIPTLLPNENLAPLPSEIPTPFPTPIPTPTSYPLGSSIVINKWQTQVKKVITVPTISFNNETEKAAGRFALVFMSVTNLDLSPQTFGAYGIMQIQDSDGRKYDENPVASFDAQIQYNTDIGADINPDATANIVAAFDIPNESAYYLLVPGLLAPQNGVSLKLNIP